MALLLWALALIYGVSLMLLAISRLVARRWRPFRRFLIGDQAEAGWERRADDAWRRQT